MYRPICLENYNRDMNPFELGGESLGIGLKAR